VGDAMVESRRTAESCPSPDPLSRAKLRQATKIREIKDALIASGYYSLDAQARALGLSRSTAWTIFRGQHKASGLSTSILLAMLSEPCLPLAVRQTVMDYVSEKAAGLYGDKPFRVRQFMIRFSRMRSVAQSRQVAEHAEPGATHRRPR
jgi:hypothetical protein